MMKPTFANRAASLAGALALAACALSALSTLAAAAAESPPATRERPMVDPWVPPDQRVVSTEAPTEGAALRAQVERKLKQSFDAADVNRAGTLTREQAAAAGLGYIAQHFDEIDRQHAGVVRFDDVKRFMQSRGAQLN